jgi:D-glycero-D-manno-heptose 1,7-bisphosphate phosphatase
MTEENKNQSRPAIFLDRDGTIIVEKDFLGDPAGIELLPRAVDALKILKKHGYLVICVSNQSGVARGYYGEDAVRAVNDRLIKILKDHHATVDGIYYCPHHPHADLPGYRKNCDCRKPKTRMARQAMKDFAIDLGRSAMVGDRAADVEFGKNLGIPAILVTTGYGRAERERIEDENLVPPDYIATDLYEAVEWILRNKPQV